MTMSRRLTTTSLAFAVVALLIALVGAAPAEGGEVR